MSSDGNTITITGLIEHVDPDGVGFLRLSGDCLVMLESAGNSIKPGMWLDIASPVASVDLYPM